MIVAVPYETGEVFQHFGHTEYMKIYEIENSEVQNSYIVSTNGQGHGALAGFLMEQDVDVLICGGIGGGALSALADADIKVFGGVTGAADEAVEAFIKCELVYNPDVHCDHHDHEHQHEEEHQCGSGCGHCGHGCH